ncbi:MAG: hypothetical protein JST36_02230 [Bacteroidetes bacterium]|nr:hypothetical protein [Bacteroidota bacterium]
MPKRLPHKKVHYAGLVVVILFLGFLGVGEGLSIHYKNLIRERLDALSAKATDSLYHISIEGIRINIFTQGVTVYGLRMVVDSTVLQRLTVNNQKPKVILDVSVPRAYISGVKWSGLSKETKLDCKKVAFYQPNISVTILQNSAASNPERMNQTSMLKRVSAASVLIDHPKITLRGNVDDKHYVLQTTGGRIEAEDWAFYPHQSFDTTRFFGAAAARVDLRNAQYSFTNNLYRYTFDRFSFDSKLRTASITDLDISPLMSQAAFYETVGYRKDLFNSHTKLISFYDLDWQSIFLKKSFSVSSLCLTQPELFIFYSKRPPVNPSLVALPPYPAQRIASIPFAINIPTVNIVNGTIRYGESNVKTGAQGTLAFNYLNGQLFNFTNRQELLAQHPNCHLVLQGRFMHRAPMGILFNFVLNSPKGAFSVNATLRDLDASMVRDQVDALAISELKSLKISQAFLRIAGNTDSTHGLFSIPYQDLRLNLKKWDPHDSDVHSLLFLSFVANKLLLFQDNPMTGDTLRLAATHVLRGQSRSFFQVLWKNVFQACVQIAVRNDGAMDLLKKKEQRKGQQRQKFFKDLFPKRTRVQ